MATAMPELPEVEFARRSLVRWFEGRRVVRSEAEPGVRTFRGSDPEAFARIRGALVSAKRRGKYLLLSFERGQGVLAHLGMTGKFVRRPKGQPEPYSKARWLLDDGAVIHFRDPRMFGRIEVVPADALPELEVVRRLGIDPLEDGLTGPRLRDRLEQSGQDIKVALMNPARIAGLGNIHAAEALFRAGIHPTRKPGTLTAEEWRKLSRGILQTIRFALDNEDDDEIAYVEEGGENPFLVYGRAGEPCPRCGTEVKSFTQAGRTTHFCPRCQLKKPHGRV